MSKATFTFGRFNPPTEVGHGKLVSAVQSHAEKSGGSHYIFPSHSQDAKKNPLSHADKVHAMSRLFPNANVVSQGKVRTAIDAMKHLEKKGHTHVTMVVGSDRVAEFHGLLSKYRKKEFPGIKKVNVVSAGNRDPDAEGAEGMSASKLRGLVSAGKKDEFVSHYSDKKLGAHIHDKVKAGLQMESTNPVGIFLLGGPGSGKDYVLKNIFSRFDLTEVQADQILNGVATELYESKQNIVINGVNDPEKISVIQSMLEGYVFDFVHVTVSNKVSRLRNEQREQPIDESKRIDKFLKAEKLAQQTEAYIFNNSINLNESSEFERVFFASQIEKLLERIVDLGLPMLEEAEPKTFMHLREKKFPPVAKDKESGLPKKYVRGLSASTAKARKAHWKKMGKLSDKIQEHMSQLLVMQLRKQSQASTPLLFVR
jgi:dephospho-CoA kinase